MHHSFEGSRAHHEDWSLPGKGRKAGNSKFSANQRDMFAWTAADMLGVDPSIIIHTLSICREAWPVTQKKRKLGEEKRFAARVEAEKLLEVGFIKEAHWPMLSWSRNQTTSGGCARITQT